jgi:hypothetical protein
MKKLFMASLALTTFAASVFLFQMSSCKKAEAQNENCPPQTHSVKGLWEGSYTIDSEPGLGSQYWNLVIKEDGTMVNETRYTGTQHFNVGTWTMSGDTLICDFGGVYGLPQHLGITERATAIFNASAGTLTFGHWENTPTATGSGSFVVTKTN